MSEKIQKDNAELMNTLRLLRAAYKANIKVLLIVSKNDVIIASSSLLEEVYDEGEDDVSNKKFPLKVPDKGLKADVSRPTYLG